MSEIRRCGWFEDDTTQTVMLALDFEDGCSRFVGGCVRNTILRLPIIDIDIATIFTPIEMIGRLETAKIKTRMTGIEHGTITAVADNRTYEITTLRRDIRTDGRRALVDFTKNWYEDAKRRDFSMNALYMDNEGKIFDPIQGMDDTVSGRVRFIGDPNQRIREDVLRILRFFRLNAEYGKTDIDASGLIACQKNADLLSMLSTERVRLELWKLLVAQNAVGIFGVMDECDILAALSLGNLRVSQLQNLLKFEGNDPDPLCRMGVLFESSPEDLAVKLRLSRSDAIRLKFIRSDADGFRWDNNNIPQQIYRLGKNRFVDAAIVSAALQNVPICVFRQAMRVLSSWDSPKFPLSGSDLIDLGFNPGKKLGKILQDAENWWVDNAFRPNRKACLEKIRRWLENKKSTL